MADRSFSAILAIKGEIHTFIYTIQNKKIHQDFLNEKLYSLDVSLTQ